MSDAGEGGEDEIELTLNPDDLLDDDDNHTDQNQECHTDTNKKSDNLLDNATNKPNPNPGSDPSLKSNAATADTDKKLPKPPIKDENKPAPHTAKMNQGPAKPAKVKTIPARITGPASDLSPVKTTPKVITPSNSEKAEISLEAKLKSDALPSSTPDGGPKVLNNPNMVKTESQELGIQIWAHCEALSRFVKMFSPSAELLTFAKSCCQKLGQLNDKLISLRLTAIRLFGPDLRFAPVTSNPAHWFAKADIESIMSSLESIKPLDFLYVTSFKSNILKRIQSFKSILFPFIEEQLWFEQALIKSGIKILPEPALKILSEPGIKTLPEPGIKLVSDVQSPSVKTGKPVISGEATANEFSTEKDVLVRMWWIMQEINLVLSYAPKKRTFRDLEFCKSSCKMLNYLNEKLLMSRISTDLSKQQAATNNHKKAEEIIKQMAEQLTNHLNSLASAPKQNLFESIQKLKIACVPIKNGRKIINAAMVEFNGGKIFRSKSGKAPNVFQQVSLPSDDSDLARVWNIFVGAPPKQPLVSAVPMNKSRIPMSKRLGSPPGFRSQRRSASPKFGRLVSQPRARSISPRQRSLARRSQSPRSRRHYSPRQTGSSRRTRSPLRRTRSPSRRSRSPRHSRSHRRHSRSRSASRKSTVPPNSAAAIKLPMPVQAGASFVTGGQLQQQPQGPYPQTLSPSAQRNIEEARKRGEKDTGPMFFGLSSGPSQGQFPTFNLSQRIDPWDKKISDVQGLDPIPINSNLSGPKSAFTEDSVPIFFSNATDLFQGNPPNRAIDGPLFPSTSNALQLEEQNSSLANVDLRITLLAKKQSKDSTKTGTSTLPGKENPSCATFMSEIFELPPAVLASSSQAAQPSPKNVESNFKPSGSSSRMWEKFPTFTGYGPPITSASSKVGNFNPTNLATGVMPQDPVSFNPKEDHWKKETDFFLRSIHKHSPSPPKTNSSDLIQEKILKRSISKDIEELRSKSPYSIRDASPPMKKRPELSGKRSSQLEKSPVPTYHGDPFDQRHRNLSGEISAPKRRHPSVENSYQRDISASVGDPISAIKRKNGSLSNVGLPDVDDSLTNKDSFSKQHSQNRDSILSNINRQSYNMEDLYYTKQQNPFNKEPQQTYGRDLSLVKGPTSKNTSNVSSPSPEPNHKPFERNEHRPERPPSKEKNLTNQKVKSPDIEEYHYPHRRSAHNEDSYDADSSERFHRSSAPENRKRLSGREYYGLEDSQFGKQGISQDREHVSQIQKQSKELLYAKRRSPSQDEHSYLNDREYSQLKSLQYHQQQHDHETSIVKDPKRQTSSELLHRKGRSPSSERGLSARDHSQLESSQYHKQQERYGEISVVKEKTQGQNSRELFYSRGKSPSPEELGRLSGKEYPQPKRSLEQDTAHSVVKDTLCICCLSRNHAVGNCPKFEQLSIEKRWIIIQNLSVDFCVLCLKVGHLIAKCDATKSASYPGPEVCCGRLHPLLHICDKVKNQVLTLETVEELFAKKNSEIQEKIERLKREKEEEAKRKELERQSARAAKDETRSVLARLKAAAGNTRKTATGNTLQAPTWKTQQETDIVLSRQEVKKAVWMESCSICESDNHISKHCPLNYCNDCKQKGHMDCKSNPMEVDERKDDSQARIFINNQLLKDKSTPWPQLQPRTQLPEPRLALGHQPKQSSYPTESRTPTPPDISDTLHAAASGYHPSLQQQKQAATMTNFGSPLKEKDYTKLQTQQSQTLSKERDYTYQQEQPLSSRYVPNVVDYPYKKQQAPQTLSYSSKESDRSDLQQYTQSSTNKSLPIVSDFSKQKQQPLQSSGYESLLKERDYSIQQQQQQQSQLSSRSLPHVVDYAYQKQLQPPTLSYGSLSKESENSNLQQSRNLLSKESDYFKQYQQQPQPSRYESLSKDGDYSTQQPQTLNYGSLSKENYYSKEHHESQTSSYSSLSNERDYYSNPQLQQTQSSFNKPSIIGYLNPLHKKQSLEQQPLFSQHQQQPLHQPTAVSKEAEFSLQQLPNPSRLYPNEGSGNSNQQQQPPQLLSSSTSIKLLSSERECLNPLLKKMSYSFDQSVGQHKPQQKPESLTHPTSYANQQQLTASSVMIEPEKQQTQSSAYGSISRDVHFSKEQLAHRQQQDSSSLNSKDTFTNPPPIFSRSVNYPPPGVPSSSESIPAEKHYYSGAIWQYFVKRLRECRKDPETAASIMELWRMAGHDEQTLKAFVAMSRPANRNVLRSSLVRELSKAPATRFPQNVSADFILDEMVLFFMPMEQQDPVEDRAASLQPLVIYIESKMKSMASMFGLDNDFITRVALAIQATVANLGFCLDDLKRYYASQGKEALASMLLQKLDSQNATLPKGITAKYIVTMVSGYLMENC